MINQKQHEVYYQHQNIVHYEVLKVLYLDIDILKKKPQIKIEFHGKKKFHYTKFQ